MAKKNVLLPNPLRRPDGTLITKPEEWPAQAAYIRKLLQENMYGVWPGKADSILVVSKEERSVLDGKGSRQTVRLLIDYRGFQFPVDAFISYPLDCPSYPAFIFNLGKSWKMEEGKDEEIFLNAGYAVVGFDRSMVHPDHIMTEEEKAQYPALPCACIMAWGWLQSTLIDWLEKEHPACTEKIAAGHSRGGKASLCAAIFDERFSVVGPMGSGCGGAGCSRYIGTLDGSRQDPARCETIGKLMLRFPYWFIPRYAEYAMDSQPYAITEKESALPFDAHFLRAAVAPRAVFNSEGTTDTWANLFGTQLCYQAAQPVFDLLGVPERNGFHVREGGHSFNQADWIALVDFCDLVLGRHRSAPQPRLNQLAFDIDVSEYTE